MAYQYGDDSTFDQSYRCYPVSFIDKPHLEKGDKIIMPPSALDRLASLQIDYPMLFELNNSIAGRVTHCGVLEFIADEGLIFLPYWMMENLLLSEGDIVQVKNKSMEKGTYVKLQPHTKDFLDISNPRAILETSLRNYSCLTTGDTIMVFYNNKKYYIDIIETKPSSAISIIETDCEVDFAAPLDYKEPAKPNPSALPNKRKRVEKPAVEEANFSPFSGSAQRLDGRSSTQSVAQTSSHTEFKSESETGIKDSNSPSSHQISGKLIFGSNISQPIKAPKVSVSSSNQEPSRKAEEQKFQAFTGKKYSLNSES